MNNSCENTYNAIGISCGISGDEARRMVEHWKSPRLPSEHWRDECDRMKERLSEQLKVIIEKETEVSQYRTLLNEIKVVAEKVLDGLDWNSNTPVDIHQMYCVNLHRLIKIGGKPPELMAPEDRLLNPWKGDDGEQEKE